MKYRKTAVTIFGCVFFVVAAGAARGECLDGNCADGKGIFKKEDEVVYVGEFVAGKMHGKGMIYYPNNVGTTVGDFLDGELNGEGFDSFPDGSSYRGPFKNGKYNGYGVYLHSDGSSYKGEFVDGDYHGQGTYTFPNGREKSGFWRRGVFIGQNPEGTEQQPAATGQGPAPAEQKQETR